MFLPCFYIWIAGFFYLLLNTKGRTICFFMLGLSGRDRTADYGSMEKIIMPWGYIPCFLDSVHWPLNSGLFGPRFFLRLYFIRLYVAVGIYFIFIGLPVMKPEKLVAYYEKTHARGKGILQWEDQQDHPLPQDFADMLGWEEMAQKAATAFHSLDSCQQANTIIFCDNYGMAGAVNYYWKKYHLPEAYSDNASFLYWIPDPLHFQNLVLLESDPE